ncbi:MAG: DNA helicase RecQ [Rikenellaceae bacterium]
MVKLNEKTLKTDNIDPLYSALKSYFGFTAFKGNQEAVIRNILDGKDTFVLMPTGGGKSLCYQLPAMMLGGVAIVISPLIALMKNQVDAIRTLSMQEGIAHFINSSLSKSAISLVKEDVLSGKTKLLYFAPESLTKDENVELLKRVKVSFYAIDEAHCISEWGHDFRPEYRRIRPIVSEIGTAPIIALTATATPKVQADIQKNLGMSAANVFKSSFNRANLNYEVRPKVSASREIIKYIKNNEGKSGIIYCLSRKKVEELSELLRVNDIKALPYHAGIDATTRAENQDKFLMEQVHVIVATIAFGMGIDKPDVRFVIHYDIPKSLEGYYQETGRAGRDGGEGNCITFYSYKDILKLEKFMQGKAVAEQEIGSLLLSETVEYAESTVCRRKILMHYFGEEYSIENCGACDNCLNPVKREEAKDSVRAMLSALEKIGKGHKSDHLVSIMCGKVTSNVKSYGHNKLEEFGYGREQSELYWRAVIRAIELERLLDKDIENYGALEINQRGEEFIKKPYSIKVGANREFEVQSGDDVASTNKAAGSGAADMELYKILEGLRRDMSKKHELPPFVIFQEQSLEDMAIQYPITMEDMCKIAGVGMGKARKFGRPFLDVIAKYVEERGIERHQDMMVKSVAKKSSGKVFLIQSIDRQTDLMDVAQSKGWGEDELFNELEAIVNSGTRLNLDYYINENIDEDKILDIMDYFTDEALTDSVSEAEVALGGDYTTTEIRLVRLKFLSDKGN